ncbi:unnamed protein product [Acanthoscelides obtectus]|uniref:Uncharacterized protein n=1 Tax=Acanthoscelides obtectus TaxID=200917 RepID=A0A9P0KLP0_ACAOB|nr:unnamed protein product [Acanthoscelides obtectus]CAK1664976.1 hypothetical protein AOBTE_LOCUS24591 [Acanthoscelides obtectus]
MFQKSYLYLNMYRLEKNHLSFIQGVLDCLYLTLSMNWQQKRSKFQSDFSHQYCLNSIALFMLFLVKTSVINFEFCFIVIYICSRQKER